MVRGDGGADVGRGFLDELRGVAGGDVLEHHLQGREALDHAGEMLVDEALLAVEHVDLGAGHLAVHQQRQADFGHGFQHREDVVDAGHAGIGVGGGAGRIQLGGVDEAAGLGGADFLGSGAVGEVEHHQRLEAAAGRARGEDALAVGVGLGGVAHRRDQVGHDDGAAEGARGVTDGADEGGAVAQVDVPVVGTQESQAVEHANSRGRFAAGKRWNATGKGG
ncbi:hypothetical protein D9M69_423550 [compost metagenome]